MTDSFDPNGVLGEVGDCPGLAVIRLGPEHAAELAGLEEQCFAVPWTEEQYRLGLANGVFKIFGLRYGPEGPLVAYLSFYHALDEMEILNVGVRPDCRRRGLGRRLLGLVLQVCYRLGVRRSFLEVRRSNAAAQNLYAQFGFVVVGERKGYYPDNGEDALLMRSDLDGGDLERMQSSSRP